MIDYSVIIRTTGKAGEKYQALLNSISALEPQPVEVIVVLPNGYDLPQERLGTETFYFCEKGMVTQRLFGIEKCKTKYALICDDDVTFPYDFVQKLYSPICEGVSELSSAPLLSFLPKKGLEEFFYAITAAAIPMSQSDSHYIKILSSTGYSYNRNINCTESKYLIAESLPWTCFFGDINSIKKIRLQDEHWLQLNGYYASLDDQTMFYKAHLMGIRSVVVTDAVYEHLDAKTSRKVLSDIAYAMEFNRYIFWHRFIYSRHKGLKKIFDRLAINYYFFTKYFYNIYRYFNKILDKPAFNAKRKALKDAKKYVKSNDYFSLPDF